jgi:hypothetical protein
MNYKKNLRILKNYLQLVNVNFFGFFLNVFSTKKHVCSFMIQCRDDAPKNKFTDEILKQWNNID